MEWMIHKRCIFRDPAKLSHVGPSEGDSFEESDPQLISLRRASTQCGRTYSDSLSFSSTISLGSCPSLPHVAISRGHRRAVENYQGRWQVENCELKWFLPDEACDLIGSLGKIHFRGDSLIRQLTFAFGVILSGNYRSGGLYRRASPEYLQACQCEKQWLCSKNLNRFEGEQKSPQFDLCPRWTRDHILTSPIEDYNSTHDPVIVIGNGAAMHSVFSFYEPRETMEMLLREARKTNGTLIPMTLHYPGVNKVPYYMESQGPPQIKAANGKMLQWAEDNNLWPLRLFEYTEGLWSRDGVHYDDENIVFVQLLLNSLWRMQREHGLLQVVPERNPQDPTNFKSGDPKDLGAEVYFGDVPRPYKSIS